MISDDPALKPGPNNQLMIAPQFSGSCNFFAYPDQNFLEIPSNDEKKRIREIKNEKNSDISCSYDEYISSENITPISINEKVNVSQYGNQLIFKRQESIVVEKTK